MENPQMFKENCLSIAYSFVALMTDYLFDLYKVEMERIEGQSLKKAKDIAAVKQKMFQDLMPISDKFVLYKDFEATIKRSEWTGLVSKIRAMINKTIETIKTHKHLTDQGLQARAQEDLNDLIKIRTKQFNDLKRKIARDREERLIREQVDDASTDSEGEETRKKMRRSKAIMQSAAVAVGKGKGDDVDDITGEGEE